MGGEYRDYCMKIPWMIFIHELLSIKKANEWTQRTTDFFDASQLVNKNRWSTFHGPMFLFYAYWDFLSLTDTIQRLEANDCENTSFVQPETRTNSSSQCKSKCVWNCEET